MFAAEWWENPLIAPVLTGVICAVLFGGWRFGRKALRILQRVETDVLKHFTPPDDPGEQDNTMPARLGRLETDVLTVRGQLNGQLDDRLGALEQGLGEIKARLR